MLFLIYSAFQYRKRPHVIIDTYVIYYYFGEYEKKFIYSYYVYQHKHELSYDYVYVSKKIIEFTSILIFLLYYRFIDIFK